MMHCYHIDYDTPLVITVHNFQGLCEIFESSKKLKKIWNNEFLDYYHNYDFKKPMIDHVNIPILISGMSVMDYEFHICGYAIEEYSKFYPNWLTEEVLEDDLHTIAISNIHPYYTQYIQNPIKENIDTIFKHINTKIYQ